MDSLGISSRPQSIAQQMFSARFSSWRRLWLVGVHIRLTFTSTSPSQKDCQQWEEGQMVNNFHWDFEFMLTLHFSQQTVGVFDNAHSPSSNSIFILRWHPRGNCLGSRAELHSDRLLQSLSMYSHLLPFRLC